MFEFDSFKILTTVLSLLLQMNMGSKYQLSAFLTTNNRYGYQPWKKEKKKKIGLTLFGNLHAEIWPKIKCTMRIFFWFCALVRKKLWRWRATLKGSGWLRLLKFLQSSVHIKLAQWNCFRNVLSSGDHESLSKCSSKGLLGKVSSWTSVMFWTTYGQTFHFTEPSSWYDY